MIWAERKIDFYRVGCVLWRHLDFVQIDGEPLMSSAGGDCDMVTLVTVLWMLGAGGRAEGKSPIRLAAVQVRVGGYLNRALVAELEEA